MKFCVNPCTLKQTNALQKVFVPTLSFLPLTTTVVCSYFLSLGRQWTTQAFNLMVKKYADTT